MKVALNVEMKPAVVRRYDWVCPSCGFWNVRGDNENDAHEFILDDISKNLQCNSCMKEFKSIKVSKKNDLSK